MFESEERRITDRIKDFLKNKVFSEFTYIMLRKGHGSNINSAYIMLRSGQILDINNYHKMVISDKINPYDVYVYIGIEWVQYRSEFYYPLLYWYYLFYKIYLSKLGFSYDIPPITGLKYVATVEVYKKYLAIELANLDTIVDNTNLRKIIFEVAGDKIISGEKKLTGEELGKILSIYVSQKLFAGHNFEEAGHIISDYYDEDNQSLIKEVARIVMDYDRIFHPYRVCYNMKTWKEIDCSSIKLD